MNLEELKEAWRGLPPPSGANLTSNNIRQMISTKYRRRLRRMLWPQLLAAIVYAYFIFLLVGFFDLLDTAFLTSLGMATVVLLLTLPILRFYWLRRLFVLSDPGRSYTTSLREFARYKLRLLTLQRAQAGIGFLLLVALCVLTTRIYGEYDVTGSKYFWAGIFSVGFLSVQVVNAWLLRRYRHAIGEAEALLSDLEN
ncbi:MAG: hypothetical protein AAFZ52_19530 [Bacteroidota bacterium]